MPGTAPRTHETVGSDGADREPADAYRWLEADDDPTCQQWLDEQDAWLAEHRPRWARAHGAFHAQLRRYTDAPAPGATSVRRGDRTFSLHGGAGYEHPVLTVRSRSGQDRVLIDPTADDPSGVTTLIFWRPSWTGHLLAYQLSAGGSEAPLLGVRDTTTGHDVTQPLHLDRPSPIAWLPNDSGFYYVNGPPGQRQVRRRLLHHPDADDVVFETELPQLSVSISPSGRWLSISTAPGAGRPNQLHLVELAAELRAENIPAPRPHLVADGLKSGAQTWLKFGPSDLLYALSTGPDGSVVDVLDPSRQWPDSCRRVIRLDPTRTLGGCVALTDPATGAGRFLASITYAGATTLALYDHAGRELSTVPAPQPGPGTITKLGASPGVSDRAWFTHTSFTTPAGGYYFDLADGRCHRDTSTAPEPASEVALADVQPIVHVHELTSGNTPVPIYVIAAPDYRDGPVPTLLTAYGGFGVTAAARFSPAVHAWVRAGGLYAIAGIRGGGEHGERWHDAGRGANKPNAFADFAAAAQWLIDQRWTTPRQLAIRGGSHAGLTVAVAITQHPERYAAAVCSGALTDMLRYPHHGLGAWWLGEFGDPDQPDQHATLLSYSPYHHVTPDRAYPPTLLTSARYDDRVGAAHTRKFAAALQHASSNPVLLRTDYDVGHGPGSVTKTLDQQAEALAFCAHHTGLTPDPGRG
jgi:prolyl oligopeptidase